MENKKTLNSRSLSLLLVVFMFAMYAVVYMTKNIFSAAMASIVEEGVMTKSQTGLINASFWAVYAVFQFAGGFIVDKYSPSKMIMIGMLGAITANLVIYFYPIYPVIIAAWMFNAISQFGLWPGVFKIVSTQIVPSMRKKAAFWMLFSGNFGLGMSLLVASFVKHWRENFVISTVTLVLILIAYVFVDKYTERKMVDEVIPVDNKKDVDVKEKAKMLPLIISSGLIVVLLICMLRIGVDNGIRMMTPVMLMESYDELPASISTRMSTLLVAFSILGTFLAGFIQSKITSSEMKAQIGIYSLTLLPMITVIFIGKIHYMWILASLCLVAVLLQSASPFTQSFVSLRFEKYGRIGTVAGIVNAAASVGNILASYVFARMAELMDWKWVVVTWMGIVAFCIILCIINYRRWMRFLAED